MVSMLFSALGNHADIDLILLDINMPRMSGLEFLKQDQSRMPCSKEIPVVIISHRGQGRGHQSVVWRQERCCLHQETIR